MRRVVVWGALTLVACGGDAPADPPVARVGDRVLGAARTAELLVLAQPFPLEPTSVEDLVRHWIGATALVSRLEAGDDPTGPEATEASTWLDRRELLLALEREGRVGPVSVPSARDEFEAGRLKLLAHVLRRVGPETSDAERGLQRRTAERLLADLVAGGAWDDAVAESQDPDTRDRSGLLGLLGPGELPPALDRVAGTLQPGQVSSVITSDAGFHILYRPGWGDVSELFERRLRERLVLEAAAADDVGVLEARGAERSPDAIRIATRIASDPFEGIGSDAPLMSWSGGALTEGALARYLASLPLQVRREMIGVSERLGAFMDEMAIRELRAQDAERNGLRIDDSTEEELRQRHAEEVASWIDALGGSDGSEPSQDAVDRHMEALVARRVPARSMPALLEAWLLARVEWSLSRTGMDAAIDGARAMLSGAMSARPPGGGA